MLKEENLYLVLRYRLQGLYTKNVNIFTTCILILFTYSRNQSNGRICTHLQPCRILITSPCNNFTTDSKSSLRNHTLKLDRNKQEIVRIIKIRRLLSCSLIFILTKFNVNIERYRKGLVKIVSSSNFP